MANKDYHRSAALKSSSTSVTKVKRADSYKLLYRVGRGSFGQVFKALELTGESREVAAKVIDMGQAEDEIWETMGEISAMSQLQHPNIVHYYTSFMEDNFLWIIMEFLNVGSVADILKAIGGLSDKQCRYIIYYMLQALDYLHTNLKLHRDIKAANVIVNSDASIKLADFGVAGQLTQSINKRRTFVGTPYWMAPEVIQQMEYDTAADIWAVGITCIEIFDKNPPHANTNPVRALFAIVNNDPPTVMNSTNTVFKNFVSTCLQKSPANRPTAHELLKHAWLLKKPNKKVMLEVINNFQMRSKKTPHKMTGVTLDEVFEVNASKEPENKDITFDLNPTIMARNLNTNVLVPKPMEAPSKPARRRSKKLLKTEDIRKQREIFAAKEREKALALNPKPKMPIHLLKTDSSASQPKSLSEEEPNTVKILPTKNATKNANMDVDVNIFIKYQRKNSAENTPSDKGSKKVSSAENSLRQLNISESSPDISKQPKLLPDKTLPVIRSQPLELPKQNFGNAVRPKSIHIPSPTEPVTVRMREQPPFGGNNFGKGTPCTRIASQDSVKKRRSIGMAAGQEKTCIPLVMKTIEEYKNVAKVNDGDVGDPINAMKSLLVNSSEPQLTKLDSFLKEWASECFSLHSS